MQKRFITLFLFLFSVLTASSQQKNKLNIPLRQVISNAEYQDSTLQLLVKGNVEEIRTSIGNYEGNFRYQFRDFAAISIPVRNLYDFSKNDFITRIEYSIGNGAPINDKVLVHNNVLPIHQGLSPLLQKYDGEGVIIGIIDTGIDLMHPDFLDSLGNSRVLHLWNQNTNNGSTIPQPFGYGREWNNSELNAGMAVQNLNSHHGSHVTGIASGNGQAVGDFKGAAPKADIIFVDYYVNGIYDWTMTVADAIEYIFAKADSLGKPCVINTSIGTYWGSHDGGDVSALRIDGLLKAKNGRAVVAAAGNAGNEPPFHLGYTVTNDTAFTWFKYNPAVDFFPPIGAVYFEAWADTADFNNVSFALGADRIDSVYSFRGKTSFHSPFLGSIYDTIYSSSGDEIGAVEFYTELDEGKYHLYVYVEEPDSSQYFFRFITTGTGKFDVWSAEFLGVSDMVSDSTFSFPDSTEFPDIVNYQMPDIKQSIVSSWQCLPSVITVGNYINRQTYLDYNGVVQDNGLVEGSLYATSSRGPTRDGRIKPDIAAPGTWVMSCGVLSILASETVNAPFAVAQGGYHRRNTGTSMSSPAVAGIVALYLQKCSNAGYQEILDAIIDHPKTDSLTGTNLPDNEWGYGKVDAFAALTYHPPPPLSSSDTSVCTNLSLSVAQGYANYQWSTGAITNSINVNQSDDYYVLVSDSSGCKMTSDTATVSVNPFVLPSPAITVVGDTVFCQGDSVLLSLPSGFSVYLWANGKTSAGIFASQTGFYNAQVFDANGCIGVSNQVLVSALTNPLSPELSQNGNMLTSTVANNFQWYYNGAPITDSTNQSLIAQDAGYYFVEVFHANGCSLFSDSVYVSPIGIAYLFSDDDYVVYPNPNNGKFVIEVRWQKSGVRNLKIYNALGEAVYQSKINSQQSTIDISSLPAGIFYLTLSSSENLFSKKIIVE